MDLTRLRHILAVARTGSFSRAAEEERITQPALSRSIAAFERHYDVILFDRGRSGAKPTPSGAIIIEQARRLLAASQDFEQNLKTQANGQTGRVAFGIGPLLASLLLPGLGAQLLRSHPDLHMHAHISTAEQLLPALFDGRIEMIIGNNWNLGAIPGAAKRDLISLPLDFYVRSGHPLTVLARPCMTDLALFPTASAIDALPGDWNSERGSFVCENYHILRDLAPQTDAIWVTASAFVTRELERGELVKLALADAQPIHSEICIISRRGRPLSPAATLVRQEIETALLDLPGS